MGKLDSMMKCAQARNLMNEKQYKKAFSMIEKVEAQKVKSIIDLRIMGEVSIAAGKYDKARDIYFLIYDKVQSRSVLYHLIYLSIKCSMLKEAEEFYEEYKKKDSESVDCYILKYYIEKAKGADRQAQIQSIKEILNVYYLEEWAYKLAKLYHKEGMEEECVAECSKIILWFGEGVTVEKALLLKLHYVEGLDISSTKAIEETRNLAAELRIAAAIADQREKGEYEDAVKPAEPDFEEPPQNDGIQYNALADVINQEAEISFTETAEQDKTKEPIEVPAEDSINEPSEEEAEELPSEKLKNKVNDMIESIIEDAVATKIIPHFAIIGEDSDKMMTVTKHLMKELCEAGVLLSPRIARITAEKVNGIHLEQKKEQLVGSCLLIENAQKLSLDSIQSLYQIMRKKELNLVVALLDNEENITDLMNRNRKLKSFVKYELYI